MPRLNRGPLLPLDREIERTLRSRQISHPILTRRSPTSFIDNSTTSSQAIDTEEEFENPFFNLDFDLKLTPTPPESPRMGDRNDQGLMGDYMRPNTAATGKPINVGVLNCNNFELRPNLINLVQQKPFHGLASEDPYQHIVRFESACSSIKHNHVTQEKIKLMLFPWSLEGAAWRWLHNFPNGTFTTWEALEKAFNDQYFNSAKTDSMREAITSFRQAPFESLHETWARFRDVLSQCPHHNLPPWMIIQTFFKAVNEQQRNTLYAASGGKLMKMSPEEVSDLISNMACIGSSYSDRSHNVRHDDTFSPSLLTRTSETGEQNRKIEELTRELAKLKAKDEARSSRKSPQRSHAASHKTYRSCDQCGGVGHDADNCPSFRVESHGEPYEVNSIQPYQGRNRGGFNEGWPHEPRGYPSYRNPPGYYPRNYPPQQQNGYSGYRDQGYGEQSYGYNNDGYGRGPRGQGYGNPQAPYGNQGYGNYGPPQGYTHQPSSQHVNEYGYFVQSPPHVSINTSAQPQSGYAQPQAYVQPPLPIQAPPVQTIVQQPPSPRPLSLGPDPLTLEFMKNMDLQMRAIKGELAMVGNRQKASEFQITAPPPRTLLPAQATHPKDLAGPTHHAHAITSIFGIEAEDPIVRVMQIVGNEAKSMSKVKKVGDDFIVEDEPYEEEFPSKAKNWLSSSHDFVLERIDEINAPCVELEVDPKKRKNVRNEIFENVVEVKKVKEVLVPMESIEQETSVGGKGESLGEDRAMRSKARKRNFTTPLPFPQRASQAKEQSDQHAKFAKLMEKVEVSLPFIDIMTQMPDYAKFLKDVVSKKRKIETHELVALTEECNAIFQNKMPKKLMDPGSFSIPCMIGHLKIDGALCDSGASVSILPLPIAKKLGVKSLSPTKMTIQLADRSTKSPMGILKGIPVKVGKLLIPTDFMVVDIPEDNHTPIILGRAFMATGGAHMDVQRGELSFNVNGELVKFCMPDTFRSPMVEERALVVGEVRDNVIPKVVKESESECLRKVSEENVEICKALEENEFPTIGKVNDNVVNEKNELCLDVIKGGLVSSETPIVEVNRVEDAKLKKEKKERTPKDEAKRSQTPKGNEWKVKRPRSCNEDWEEMTKATREAKSILSKILEKLCLYAPHEGGKENVRESRGCREGDPG